MNVRKKIESLLAVMALLVMTGTLGFHFLEGWNWLDSVYTTVITLGTVGYGDFHPVTAGGKVFSIFLVFVGFSVISYTLVQLTEFVVEGHLNNILRVRRVDGQVRKLQDHFIVCGAGKSGRHVVEELIKNQLPFVVIDKDLERFSSPLLQMHPHIIGDATDDEVLRRAGIDKAKSLSAALDTDELNLFLVLTAKHINPKLRCVTKCIHESARTKLLRAGADAVVAPHVIGGLRMASEMVRPNVVSFLDVMLRENKGVRFEEATLPQGSSRVGKTLGSLNLMEKLGLTAIAIRQEGKTFLYNPPAETLLRSNDTLVVIGEPEKLVKLRLFLKK